MNTIYPAADISAIITFGKDPVHIHDGLLFNENHNLPSSPEDAGNEYPREERVISS